MKKLILFLLAALLLCLPCFGESFTGQEGLLVRLTADGKLESNLSDTGARDDALQPGDDVTFTVQLLNSNADPTEWYLKNDVLHSLEDRSAAASGGAYSYRLAFSAAGGEELVLFDSDTIGGETDADAPQGLHQAVEALRDYVFVARLEPGQSGTVTLRVALEGESQGNAYQDTLADMTLHFAVALESGDDVTVVKTGDETRLFPLYVVFGVSGLALLGIGTSTLVRRRRRKGGAAE